MDITLSRFIKALRRAEVRVSTAETLDAIKTLQCIGYSDRLLLKNALATVLAKSITEKQAFDDCFERFFGVNDWPEPEAVAEYRDTQQAIEPASLLARLLLDTDPSAQAELTTQILTAASSIRLDRINLLTQKGPYTQRIMEQLGVAGLNAELKALQNSPQASDRQRYQILQQRREWLRERVRDYVERQFLLYADVYGKELRQKLLYQAKLAGLDQRYYQDLQQLIQKLAKKLIALHARRKQRGRRGQLHMARTLRHNMAYAGNLFELHWKAVKLERPKIFAICDVSGSVGQYSRFMLMFLYSLEDIIPKVRAFAFSSELSEVTDLFRDQPLSKAVAETLYRHGGGSTDYGQAWLEFSRLCAKDIDSRSTIIVLGDGRNNYGPHHAKSLQQLYRRCRRLIWLNPEPVTFWASGDSEMSRYSAYCHQVKQCNSLRQLERAIAGLLRSR